MANRFRKLGMEQMEARQMMAGDVTAFMSGGNLIINEAAGQIGQDNHIRIEKLQNGIIRVTGYNGLSDLGGGGDLPIGTGNLTLVNGAEFVDFNVPLSGQSGDLIVNLGRGHDDVNIYQFYQAPSFRNVVLNVGAKNGADVDEIYLQNIRVNGSLTIDTGAGDDDVSFIGGSFGAPADGNRVSINTGAGADYVRLIDGTYIRGSLDIQTFKTVSENDADQVYFDYNTFITGNVDVRMGGGADSFQVTNPAIAQVTRAGLEVNGTLTVDMGAGNDTVFTRSIKTVGDFRILTGAGADNVTLDHRVITTQYGNFISQVGGNLDVQTYASLSENDVDTVKVSGGRINGSLLARLGGGNDNFLLDAGAYIGNDVDLDTGTGNDSGTISGFVVDQLMARFGEGDDTLTLGTIWAYRLIADGGIGVDRMTTTSGTGATYFDKLGWEFINGRRTMLDYSIPNGVVATMR